MNGISKIISLVLRLVVAVILLQTLYFKFGSHPESIYIFTKVGIEPWGRYLTGTMELIASVLLLIPATYWIGALLASGLMGGAIFMHLTRLGIEVQGDGGYLFMLALIVLAASMTILYLNRATLFSKLEAFRIHTTMKKPA